MPKTRNTKSLHAFVARGKNKSTLLYPHLHEDGKFVVSKTRFIKDYVYVSDEADLERWLLNGFRLRMSNLTEGITAASLIEPRKIYRPVCR